jgi:hypothetical protein
MEKTPLSRVSKLLSILESGAVEADQLDMELVAARLHEIMDLLRPIDPAPSRT